MTNLPDLAIGDPVRHGAVTVFPVHATHILPRLDLEVAGPALARGDFQIHEAPERATVGMLEARNQGRRRVLIVEGDHVLGAKQNRMLTSSALIGARSRVLVPASCVEQGRWQGPSARFDALGSAAPASLRRIAKLSVTKSILMHAHRSADQDRIWSTIADQQRRLHVASTTRALAHTFAERACEIEDAAARLPRADSAIGIAIAIADELVSLDVFDSSDTCAHYWPRLVHGAVLEGLAVDRRRATEPIASTAVAQLVASARAATWSRVAPVGDGEEQRTQFATGTAVGAASLLTLDGRLVHLGVVTPVELDSTATPRAHRMSRNTELPAQLAERYRIVERIGVGGTKEVFRASALAGGPDVAIARMPYVDDMMFDREIASVRRIDSVYVPKIHETVIDEFGDGYIVMEHVNGPTLANLVGAGALAVADAAPILLAFARGLAAIHEAHVLHRDVKLENAMLATSPAGVQLKILDFGMSARARCASTAVGELRFGGTLPYMAREVLRGRALDARTDVYAFGVCCYRLLAGDFPAPPAEHESEFDYMNRLVHLDGHDLSRLPPLPASVASILRQMLDLERDFRPLMPDVVAAFERGFGDRPLRLPDQVVALGTPVRRPAPSLAYARTIAQVITSPEHVVVAPCMQAPIIALAPAEHHTLVSAFRLDGSLRWSRRVDGRYTAALRADLDGDGMREVYLAGPGRFAVLGASGTFRLARELPAYSAQPTLLAIHDRETARIAVDGRLVDPLTGADLGTLPFAYQGNGAELVATDDRRGLVYNGFALQAFRGAHATGAAVCYHRGDNGFLVAHLEEAHTGTPRVQLAVYGPGGGARHVLPVAEAQLPTGDTAAIARLLTGTSALFGPASSPLIALAHDHTAVAIAALLDPDAALPPTLAAFELPSGRALWRTTLARAGGRAILADVDGDGRPELVVGDGHQVIAYDPWSGGASTPLDHAGLPIAFGDPFASGHAHLVTVSPDGIDLFRGPVATSPGTMQWTGPRGDLWRTGALRADGQPLGPL